MGFEGRLAAGGSRAKLPLRLIFLIISSSLIAGCASAPSSQQKRVSVSQGTASPRNPDVLIYADEAMLRKPYAIIGGKIENVSGTRLEEVAIELELQRRADGSKERRMVSLNPKSLAPGEKGAYSLKIVSDEWSDSRIVALRSRSTNDEISFRTLPGARRPPERLPAPSPITRVIESPGKKKSTGNDDFINTPDNPVSVP